jgi:hypothetical protein
MGRATPVRNAASGDIESRCVQKAYLTFAAEIVVYLKVCLGKYLLENVAEKNIGT